MLYVIIVHDLESPIGTFDTYDAAHEWMLDHMERFPDEWDEDMQWSIVPLQIPKK